MKDLLSSFKGRLGRAAILSALFVLLAIAAIAALVWKTEALIFFVGLGLVLAVAFGLIAMAGAATRSGGSKSGGSSYVQEPARPKRGPRSRLFWVVALLILTVAAAYLVRTFGVNWTRTARVPSAATTGAARQGPIEVRIPLRGEDQFSAPLNLWEKALTLPPGWLYRWYGPEGTKVVLEGGGERSITDDLGVWVGTVWFKGPKGKEVTIKFFAPGTVPPTPPTPPESPKPEVEKPPAKDINESPPRENRAGLFLLLNKTGPEISGPVPITKLVSPKG